MSGAAATAPAASYPLAGLPASAGPLLDVDALLAAYHELSPDPEVPAQRVAFGTSGHRGSAFTRSFNRAHVLAISQALCEWRAGKGIDGPLFIGVDTHALSAPAFETALEVFAGNGVEVRISRDGEYTPTPAVSHAILGYNRGRSAGLADGVVVTPSHNPPEDGGYKYNQPHGGPADTEATRWIEQRANAILAGHGAVVRRLPHALARAAATTSEYDFLGHYVDELGALIDFDAIRASGIRMGVDPLGGAGVHYWRRIATQYRIPLEVLSEQVDPRFAFMTRDWDGSIRMDPSSPQAMRSLVGLKDRFDIAFACDTDHDRHGIVAPSVGLLPTNHFLSAAIDYLFRHRPEWPRATAIGKTLVSSAMIDRVAARLGRPVLEVPVGFKWFVPGLSDGSLGVAAEESAGATFLRRDGRPWTTDKDGIAPGLLAAEMTARTGCDPGVAYRRLCEELGESFADRIEARATVAQKQALSRLSPAQVVQSTLAGEPIQAVLDRAPGNDAPIGGIKVVAAGGWFAARPSGTEDIYKIYAESFRSREHLASLFEDAEAIVALAIGGA